MAETQHPHKFRHLIAPGSNFAFVSKFRLSVFLSCIAMLIGIGSLFVNKAMRGSYMNWTIDFKGGTEIIYDFKAKDTGNYVKADPHTVREALEGARATSRSPTTAGRPGPTARRRRLRHR